MKRNTPCNDCLLSRVTLECDLAGADGETTEEILTRSQKLLAFLESTPYSHPAVASHLHRSVYSWLNTDDPFRELKENSNKDAAAVFEAVSDRLVTFRDLVLGAVIGNIFDYGVKGHEISDDFYSFFIQEFKKGFYIDDTSHILPLCSDIVYFTDNCGEIIFDRALLSFLKSRGSHITLVVRDAFMLNDATMEDVETLDLRSVADEVYTTGCGKEIGIRFDCLPGPVMQAIDQCTLLISKGMANYESLREEEGPIPVAYLLAAKCDPIAEELGVPRGAKVAVLRNSSG